LSKLAPLREINLLQQIVVGDSNAFSEVYELFQDKIFVFAYSLTKDRNIAEEIVQQVFLKLWEKRSQIDANQPFDAYIKRITYNLIIDFFRKIRRDNVLQEALQKNMEMLPNTSEDIIASKQLEIIYRNAIELLPPQKKRAYLLAKDESLSYKEIGEKMKLSKNTVRNHMTVAIQFIREHVSKHYFILLVFVLNLLTIIDYNK